MLCKVKRSGITSNMYLYCSKNARDKSFQVRTWFLFSLRYHSDDAPVKLSWKMWMRSFSLCACTVILLQYIIKCISGHEVSSYFSNLGILKWGGMTKSDARFRSSGFKPLRAFLFSTAFSLCSSESCLCCNLMAFDYRDKPSFNFSILNGSTKSPSKSCSWPDDCPRGIWVSGKMVGGHPPFLWLLQLVGIPCWIDNSPLFQFSGFELLEDVLVG